MRVGFVPRPRAVTSEPGSAAAPQRKKAAEEMSPGHVHLAAAQARGADGHPEPVDAEVGPHAPEHPLGVVAGERRLLDHRSRPSAPQAGQQDGRLHLGARHREHVARRRGAAAPG